MTHRLRSVSAIQHTRRQLGTSANSGRVRRTAARHSISFRSGRRRKVLPCEAHGVVDDGVRLGCAVEDVEGMLSVRVIDERQRGMGRTCGVNDVSSPTPSWAKRPSSVKGLQQLTESRFRRRAC